MITFLKGSRREFAGFCVLLILLTVQLILSIRRESQTWDEGNHIYAGYRTWTNSDYGLNPEHPPLVKLLATIPLFLAPEPKLPALQNRFFKEEAFLGGKEFLYQNNAEQILFRTRVAAGILTLLLAVLVFIGTKEMFGSTAAFIALTLLTFDPNLLAHGALVTTDAGLSCFMFASVYAFYRYVKRPTIWRLVIAGLAVGLVLAVKHTGILILPILVLVALVELVHLILTRCVTAKKSLKLLTSTIIISLIGVLVLWSFYRFRYESRADGLHLNPPLTAYVQELKPHESWSINTLSRFHLLPESYLYGLADVRLTANYYTSYLLGKVYAHGVWFYFPVAFLIKSTLGFLALALLTLGVVVARRLRVWREIVFLIIPVVFYLIVAITVGMNIGVRHILIVYTFLWVLIGGACAAVIRANRKWLYVVVALLFFHAMSSLRTFPTYIAYSNELWGGPSQTYRYLTDSNSDWGQQLKSLKLYLDARGVKDCWFVYFAEGVVDTKYWGIPCKPLPTISTLWLNERTEVPASIDGPVLISASNLSSVELGPGSLDPYDQFKRITPTAVIDHGIFVFDGHFDVPLASALGKTQRAREFLASNQPEKALLEAQEAARLAPDSVITQLLLGDMLRELGQADQARVLYERALQLAKTIEPEFQIRSIPEIESRLQSIQNAKP